MGIEDAHVKETTLSVRQNVGVVRARKLVKIGTQQKALKESEIIVAEAVAHVRKQEAFGLAVYRIQQIWKLRMK